MSLRNPKLFGLNVKSNLADVENTNESLSSLNLSINDLDIIRGSRNLGATRGDWISFSGLNTPIYKSLDRFYWDSFEYDSILTGKSGADTSLFGNLNVNGRVDANSIRYRYISGVGTTATVKIGDISTSLVSSWSSLESPATNISPIFYGSRVGIITGGSLQFGSPSLPNQIRLQTSITPQEKEFPSEIPTHKINCNIGGKQVTLYAMKGIPFIFTGNFRRFAANIRLTSLIDDIQPSWKVVETQNSNSFTNFTNIGRLSSTINYRSSTLKERNIQFYYNPNNISQITINSAGIFSLSEVSLPNLTNLNLSFNKIKNFPDLTSIAPNIQRIYFRRNPLYLSDNPDERRFDSIISKIPSGISEITLGETFFGSIGTNSIGNRFSNLKTLNLSRNNNLNVPYFHPDDLNPSGELPNVSNTCENYDVTGNDFRSIGNSSSASKNIKDLTNLITLSLRSNWNLTDPNFSIASESISSVVIHGTNLPLPNLSNKTSLTFFDGAFCRNIGDLFDGNTYKFDNCSSLSVLSLRSSRLTGRMPKFTNLNLTFADFRDTNLQGGDPSGDNSYVIPEKTFELSPNLQYALFYSRSFLTSPIHPNAFTYLPNAYYLQYISGGRTTGDLPSIQPCSKLTYLIFHWNKLTNISKPVYNFSSNPEIYYVDMSYNQFTNNIPEYKNLSRLSYLYLNNNQFTTLSKFQNLTELLRFHAHNNLLTGNIPDFGDCPKLTFLLLHNNRFNGYTIGSISKLYRLRFVNFSNNLLTQTSINQIIDDLEANYNGSNRGNVTINLRGNASPGAEALVKIELLRSKGWTITF